MLASKKRYALSKETKNIQHGRILTLYKDKTANTFVEYHRNFYGNKSPQFILYTMLGLLSSVPQLSDVSFKSINDPITLTEMEDAMDSFTASISPGSDGKTC